MDYGAIHHFLYNSFNEIDLFFVTLDGKIRLLEQNTQNTDRLYRVDKAEAQSKIEEVYDRDLALAKSRGNDQLDRFKNVMLDHPKYFWNHAFSGWVLTGNEKAAAIVIS